MVMGSCLWISRELWGQTGGFPEWMGSIAEDMYLCCAARMRGHPVCVTLTSGYRHMVGKSFGGGKVVKGALRTNARRRALSERNKTFVLTIFLPLPVLILVLPLHVLLLIAEGLILALFRQRPTIFTEIYLHAVCSLLFRIDLVISERRNLARSRSISPAGFLRAFICYPWKLRLLLRHGIPIIEAKSD